MKSKEDYKSPLLEMTQEEHTGITDKLDMDERRHVPLSTIQMVFDILLNTIHSVIKVSNQMDKSTQGHIHIHGSNTVIGITNYCGPHESYIRCLSQRQLL